MKTDYKTIFEVKQDFNFIGGLQLMAEYGIAVYFLYKGGDKLEYYVFADDMSILFHGDDYKPSPLNNIDSLEAMTDFLGFVCCKPGDTDDEYFKDYTEAQMKWANSSDCERLQVLVYDFENRDSDYFEGAKKEFENALIN